MCGGVAVSISSAWTAQPAPPHLMVSMGCSTSSFAARVAAPLINPFLNFKTAESPFAVLLETDCPSSAVFEESSITATLTVLTDRKTMLVLKAIIAALQTLGGVQWSTVLAIGGAQWSTVLAIGFKRAAGRSPQ